MKLHLIDGTYELFRAYHALPRLTAPDGRPCGAVRGLLQTLLLLLKRGDVTHVGCAFDHVIESFRNQLFSGYKTGAGVPEDLLSQFELAERAASALGIAVWPMVEFEADDAIASAVHKWSDCEKVERVVICSPDKDLAQAVSGDRVVLWDRRADALINEDGVWSKFGVGPASVPDYLALVGDAADGIPGIPRWGAKSAAAVLARYKHIQDIPEDSSAWDVSVRGAPAMAKALAERRDEAMLYRRLATLRRDVPLQENFDSLEWRGAFKERFQALCDELGFGRLRDAPHRWREG